MIVDIIFDPGCPWCFIGKRRFQEALESRSPHSRSPTVRWWPFLLNPDLPATGLEREAYLALRFGSEARARKVFGAITTAGESAAIEFAFDRIRRTPNTVDAHRLVRFAAGHGKADAAVEALFARHFIYAEDIGKVAVLIRIGSSIGLPESSLHSYLSSGEDVAWVNDSTTRAHRLGINGVPAFVFNDQMVISGAQEPAVLSRMLEVTGQAAVKESDASRSAMDRSW